jgi:hypothetical protein
MRCSGLSRLFVLLALAGTAGVAQAQQAEPTTREGAIAQAQAEKSKKLTPYVPNKGEQIALKVENIITGEGRHLHPFFDSAYSGGGFAFGAGYLQHVSPFNYIDVRGSYSLNNYKRAEVEFVAPKLFHRRGHLSVLGGWREATQVKFFGLGNESPSDARANYAFQRPQLSALLTLWPTRRYLLVRGGYEWAKWSLEPAGGRFPDIGDIIDNANLPGVDSTAKYRHAQLTVGFDWRTSPGYSRRGGYYGITAHDYDDTENRFGFHQIDYEAIQHFPVLRERWVFSFRARAQTTNEKKDERTPFFMLPYLGGSSSLRGYTSLRFRDQNSLLFQGEWRIMASRFLDSAVFYDAGKVTARRSDLDFNGLKHDYGFGVRFHGPLSTPLRLELARGNEGLILVVSTSAVF